MTTPVRQVTLKPEQMRIVDFVVTHPFCAVWGDIGCGKTLATLHALQVVRPLGHTLVIAPKTIARSVWIDEMADHGLPIRCASLIVNEHDRDLTTRKRHERYREVFDSPPSLWFVNQELVADLVEHTPRSRVNGREVIDWPFPTVVIDEAQRFKSHRSKRFRALRKVRPAISRLIELTGTPTPGGPHDLWSQMYLLDRGAALGSTVTRFRDQWFDTEVIPGTTQVRYVPSTGAETEIPRAVEPLVVDVRTTSPLAPPVIDDRWVRLPADTLRAYESFRKELVLSVVDEAAVSRAEAAFEDWLAHDTSGEADRARADLAAEPDGQTREAAHDTLRSSMLDRFRTSPDERFVRTMVADNRAVLTSKLMQFASGTLYTTDPDDPSTKGRFEVIHDEKLQMLEYVLRNADNEPTLVAYHFKSDRDRIVETLSADGFDVEVFDGSREMVHRWNARRIPVMLLHPASAGPGLNLQHGGSRLVWYTLPFSLEHYEQLNGRLLRTGQTKRVTIHRLMTRGTQDERMPGVLAAKAATQKAVRDAVSRFVPPGMSEDALLTALEKEVLKDLGDLWVQDRI